MKTKKIIVALLGAIAVTGIGVSTVANAARSNFAHHKFTLSTSSENININVRDQAQEAKELAEFKAQFKEAGINLTPQQDVAITQAVEKMRDDYEKVFKKDAVKTIGQVLYAASLPSEEERGKMMESIGFSRPIATFYESVSNAMTPEQRPTWERIWKEQAAKRERSSQANGFKWEGNIASVAEQKQQFEELKKEFQDAGLPLSSQQEKQMLVAQERLNAEVEQAFKTNPNQALLSLAGIFFAPKEKQGEAFVESSIGKSTVKYLQAVDTILTPEQQKVWQKKPNNSVKNHQS